MEDFSPQATLRESVEQRPTSKPRRGVSWHIGNVETLDAKGLYFRLGKMSKRTLPMLEPSTGDFIKQEFANAPYTHVLLDWELEVCALARNPLLAATPDGIARRLRDVLNDSASDQGSGATFRVGPVRDPEPFLKVLGDAYAIKSFSFTFTKKNLFDANKDFVLPFENLVGEAKANEGKVTLKGTDLDSQPVKEIAASAAASGDGASARIQITEDSGTTTRSLHGDAASVPVNDLDIDGAREQALEAARAEYERIKSAGGEAT